MKLLLPQFENLPYAVQYGHLPLQTSASSHQHGLESTAAARETSLAHSHKESQGPSSGNRAAAEGLGCHETDITVLLRTETRVTGPMQVTHGRAETTGQVVTVSSLSDFVDLTPETQESTGRAGGGKGVCASLCLTDSWVPVTWPAKTLELSQFLPRSCTWQHPLCQHPHISQPPIVQPGCQEVIGMGSPAGWPSREKLSLLALSCARCCKVSQSQFTPQCPVACEKKKRTDKKTLKVLGPASCLGQGLERDLIVP